MRRPASFGWRVDTVAPETSDRLRPGRGLTSSSDASFAFSADEPASFECSLDGAPFATCGSPQEYAGLADGEHGFEVRAVDEAGNVDASPASFGWRVDTVAPETSDRLGPGRGHLEQRSRALRSPPTRPARSSARSTARPSRSAARRRSTSAWRTVSTCSRCARSTRRGTWMRRRRASRWRVDTVAPETSIVLGAGRASLRAAIAASCSRPTRPGRSSVRSTARSSRCAARRRSTAAWRDGAHVFEVRAIDEAGNVDASPAVHRWRVDTVAPETSIVFGAAGGHDRARAPAFAFAADEAGARSSARSTARLRGLRSPQEYGASSRRAQLRGAGDRRGREHGCVAGELRLARGHGRAGDVDRVRAACEHERHRCGVHVLLGAGCRVRVLARRCSVRGVRLAAELRRPRAGRAPVRGACDRRGREHRCVAGRARVVGCGAAGCECAGDVDRVGGRLRSTSEHGCDVHVLVERGGLVFACSLDGAAVCGLHSPQSYRGLALGAHQLRGAGDRCGGEHGCVAGGATRGRSWRRRMCRRRRRRSTPARLRSTSDTDASFTFSSRRRVLCSSARSTVLRSRFAARRRATRPRPRRAPVRGAGDRRGREHGREPGRAPVVDRAAAGRDGARDVDRLGAGRVDEQHLGSVRLLGERARRPLRVLARRGGVHGLRLAGHVYGPGARGASLRGPGDGRGRQRGRLPGLLRVDGCRAAGRDCARDHDRLRPCGGDDQRVGDVHLLGERARRTVRMRARRGSVRAVRIAAELCGPGARRASVRGARDRCGREHGCVAGGAHVEDRSSRAPGRLPDASPSSRTRTAGWTRTAPPTTSAATRSSRSGRKGPRDNFRALVRFALPAAIPQGCRVGSASLRLFAASATPGRVLHALRVATGWSESLVTWNTQPQTTGAPAATASGVGARLWDVTAQVQAMYDSTALHGFLIRDAAENGDAEQSFHSREKGESPPELTVVFAPAGG